MNRWCRLAHALADVDAPGEVGAAARWEAAEYARLVQAGQMERWCGCEAGEASAAAVPFGEAVVGARLGF